ncbi:MAG: cysteine desulfurase [Clostridia bacterium]|nr:cysteine desulfurase [Clostridia bacterium]
MNRIYLDNAATTAVLPEVLEKMLPYFSDLYGNAGSSHSSGRSARHALEESRQTVAECLGCSPDEVYFTSGGTESNNWAIKGTAFASREKGNHIITCATEHHAVLDTCQWLETQGFQVTYLPVDHYGQISLRDAEAAINDQTILVSIMAANNETGTLQPIEELAAICRDRQIPFHTDAVQAVGHMPLNINLIGCDMLSISAHKFHGPKGTGVLFMRQGIHADRLLHGGAQERGKRASTENIAGIVGLAEALRICCEDMQNKCRRISELRDLLLQGLLAVPGVIPTGHPVLRLPNICSISVRGADSISMLMQLDMAGIDASAGSACTSGSTEPSHVLKAMGLGAEDVKGALRFSLSALTQAEEILYVLRVFPDIVRNIRRSSFESPE